MTWTKTTDRFPLDAQRARLSDAAYRLHHEGLSWVNQMEDGPEFDALDLRRLSCVQDPEKVAAELVACGWWEDLGTAYKVVKHYDDQIEPRVLQRRREMDAKRQRAKRLRAVGIDPDTGEMIDDPPKAATNGTPSRKVSRRDIPRDDHRDDLRDPGRVGTGRDRTVQDRTGKTKDAYKGERSFNDETSSDAPDDPWEAEGIYTGSDNGKLTETQLRAVFQLP